MKVSRLLLIAVIIALGVGSMLLVNRPNTKNVTTSNTEQDIKKPIIMTTLFPFYDFTSKLVGSEAEVSLLLPPGVEPHSFEPTPQDIIKIQEADIFIYTGDIMEPWVTNIVANIPESVKVINASEGITLIKSEDDHSHDNHSHDDHSHDDHSHDDTHNNKNRVSSNLDPHFWLDFNYSIIATKNISKTISNLNIIDNTNLESNTNSLITSLEELNKEYQTTLAQCKNKTILQAGHRTFEYLANKYKLEYITTDELSPNSDTSAKDIANLINEIRITKSKTVFTEELIEPRIANTIASETGASVLELNGAHNISSDKFNSQISFVDIMKQNLENLSIGLECK
jgi:zinc transport system substrate-binding protein